MVRGVQGVANQHRVAALGVQAAVGFIAQLVVAQAATALQRQGLAERHGLGRDGE